MHALFGLVLLMAVGLECGIVKRSMRRVGPPPPMELLSLSLEDRKALIIRTLDVGKRLAPGGHLNFNTIPEVAIHSEADDGLFRTYGPLTLNWLSRGWHLTPDQMQEIQDTGKLCNDKGECLDLDDDWGTPSNPYG
ncbi:unnamed protein product [Meganyctiphanes norvegica]|uniref:Uncharacterized protein n=1 Tax=Meganyctiphanes norvegica TaxID=48144 RepID=A0AAV2QTN5_MEGNR